MSTATGCPCPRRWTNSPPGWSGKCSARPTPDRRRQGRNGGAAVTTDSTEAAMLRVYEGAWRKAYNAPDAKRGAGHRAGLAAVVAMPEVRDAIADEMENCAHEWR